MRDATGLTAALAMLVAAAASPAQTAESTSIMLPKDTPVQLMVMTEVSTRDRHPGDRFRLAVNEAVTTNGRTLIPVGTPAWGEVVAAEPNGSLGKAGSLRVRLLSIDLHGTAIPISADSEARGRGVAGSTVMGVIGLGVAGLFTRGNTARIKAGELITAFTSADVALPAPAGP